MTKYDYEISDTENELLREVAELPGYDEFSISELFQLLNHIRHNYLKQAQIISCINIIIRFIVIVVCAAKLELIYALLIAVSVNSVLDEAAKPLKKHLYSQVNNFLAGKCRLKRYEEGIYVEVADFKPFTVTLK